MNEENQNLDEVPQIHIINNKSRNLTNNNYTMPKSSIKLKHNYLMNNISKAAGNMTLILIKIGQTDRTTYFKKNAAESLKDIHPDVQKMKIKTSQSFRSKKRSIEWVVDIGEKNKNVIEVNNEYFNSHGDVKISHYSISESSVDHYIKENIYGTKK